MASSSEAGTTTLIVRREIFGTSEDDAPELDYSADSENGKSADAMVIVSER